MPIQQRGSGQSSSYSRRRRRGEVRVDSPHDSSDYEDAQFEEPSYHDTHHTSSRRRRHHITTSSTGGVNGSEISTSEFDTRREHRRTGRHATPDIARLPDPFDVPPQRYEDTVYAAGDWMDDPPHGGWPQPTYGYNGLSPPDHRHSQSGPDMFGLPPPPSRSSQQHLEPIPRAGRNSRREEPLPRPRSRERDTTYSDDRRERHTSRDRHERHRRQDRYEYHETHEYNEHRERDLDRRRYIGEEHVHSERDDRRRRRRSHSREPRYR